jgi:hypothetical protein
VRRLIGIISAIGALIGSTFILLMIGVLSWWNEKPIELDDIHEGF